MKSDRDAAGHQTAPSDDTVLDVFCTKHGDALRVYLADWAPPFLRACFGKEGEVDGVLLDFDDLDTYMAKRKASYQKRISRQGDVQLVARGYSAQQLAYWLAGMFESGLRAREEQDLERRPRAK